MRFKDDLVIFSSVILTFVSFLLSDSNVISFIDTNNTARYQPASPTECVKHGRHRAVAEMVEEEWIEPVDDCNTGEESACSHDCIMPASE